MYCRKYFDVAPGKNLHTTLDIINFLFKNCALIPFGMLSPKIATFSFFVTSVSLYDVSPEKVEKD